MHEAIKNMLSRYQLTSTQQCNQAMREIIQEVALLGLWRAKFFESAAFYGGTALRILYGLDRFSEDLDFSLLKEDKGFSLSPYNRAIKKELESYGFNVEVASKQKNMNTQIESAFIKANTKQEFIQIGIPEMIYKSLHTNAVMKIKLEVDTDPPLLFRTEAKPIMDPVPVSINTYVPSDLFAGKMHAVLCRLWKNRVKGRDWYDFVWFVRRGVPLNLSHLEARMQQSGHLSVGQGITQKVFLTLLKEKIESLDIGKAQADILPFVTDEAQIASWSKDYFASFAEKITFYEKS